jgi:hypothetical protein
MKPTSLPNKFTVPQTTAIFGTPDNPAHLLEKELRIEDKLDCSIRVRIETGVGRDIQGTVRMMNRHYQAEGLDCLLFDLALRKKKCVALN